MIQLRFFFKDKNKRLTEAVPVTGRRRRSTAVRMGTAQAINGGEDRDGTTLKPTYHNLV